MLQELSSELFELAEWASGAHYRDAPGDVKARFLTITLDTLGVMAVGGSHMARRAPDAVGYAASGRAPRPPVSPEDGVYRYGTASSAPLLEAISWNGRASVCLELDEGNKYVRGHPATHVFPAALAVAQAHGVDGETLLSALLVGHEVASRFGRATTPNPGVHPHGNWGIAGAAAAVARLLAFDKERMAFAIDIASGVPIASNWESAIRGSAARDLWIGMANIGGVLAADAAAGPVVGNAAWSLGNAIGRFTARTLSDSLGTAFSVRTDYIKRHPSCGYTHSPADAALALLAEEPALDACSIESIEVTTHAAASQLSERAPANELAARFSIPWTVAVALVHGRCPVDAFDPTAPAAAAVRRLTAVTDVQASEEFNRMLPDERGARVRVRLAGGRILQHAVTNPVGDAANSPLTHAEVVAKLSALFEEPSIATRLSALVEGLDATPDAAARIAETLAGPLRPGGQPSRSNQPI